MSSPARPFGPESGFTLIEVLVATALLAVVAAMVFGSLILTNQAIEVGRDHSAREQKARRVLRLMAEEISFSRQDNRFLWVGVNGTQGTQPADTLAFLAANDGSGGPSARETDTVRVVYTRDGDRLIRFANKNLYGLTDESLEQVELADQVKAFNLRYYDPQSRTWLDEWTGSNKKVPAALLIELTFESPGEDPRTVREWVAIEES